MLTCDHLEPFSFYRNLRYLEMVRGEETIIFAALLVVCWSTK
jgi:hypothetical protein